jgi:hypothetical protein
VGFLKKVKNKNERKNLFQAKNIKYLKESIQ